MRNIWAVLGGLATTVVIAARITTQAMIFGGGILAVFVILGLLSVDTAASIFMFAVFISFIVGMGMGALQVLVFRDADINIRSNVERNS